jgi:DNA-binding CsgD family transcriptional regulator
MKNKEFYFTPKGGIMITDEHGTRELTPNSREFVSAMIGKIGEFYPDALEKASKEYANSRYNVPYFEFLIVRRFLKCNFGKYDSTMDMDQIGNFHFEEPECPLRGECPCEGIICKPEFNSKLSDREKEVMQMLYEGATEDNISESLCISTETVRTHKRNAFRRTRVHSLPEFFLFARNTGLFK